MLNELTRNVVSMIEVSYMSGHCRRLIVMIQPYPRSGHTIKGEKLSDEELNDLENSLATVHDLVIHSYKIKVCQLEKAIH